MITNGKLDYDILTDFNIRRKVQMCEVAMAIRTSDHDQDISHAELPCLSIPLKYHKSLLFIWIFNQTGNDYS